MISLLYVGNDPEPARGIPQIAQAQPGWSVESVPSAAEALDRLAQHQYTAVIAEYRLPDMDGSSLLEKIRSAGNPVPVIIAAVNADERYRDSVRSAGGAVWDPAPGPGDPRYATLETAIREAAGRSPGSQGKKEGDKDLFEPVLRSPVSHERVRNTVTPDDPLLAGIFSLTPDGISVVNPDMTILGVNSTVEAWYAHEAPLAGKKCYQAYYGRDAPCKVCPAREAVRTGQATYAVMPRMGPEEEIRGWLDVSSFPVTDIQGQPTAVIECLTDITARKQVRQLIAGEREVLNSGPAVVITWKSGHGGDIESVTPNIQERFGYLPSDLTAGIIRYPDLVHPDDQAAFTQERGRHGDKEASYRMRPYRLRKKDGSYRWIADYVTVTQGDTGAGGASRSFLVDITEEREIAVQLRQNERLFRVALDTAGIVAWMADLATGHRSFLGDVRELFGYQGDEIGQLLTFYEDFMHPDDRNAIVEAYKEHVSTGSPFFSAECRVRGKDGGWFWLEVRGTVAARDKDNEPRCIIGSARDITGSRSDTDASHAANKKLHLLSSVTRHDILNQVMVTLGYLALLEEMVPTGSEYHEFCKQATNATKRIQRQITFTRDYQDLGAKPPEWQLVSEVVHHAAGAISSDLAITARTGRLELFADPLLERVFFNLFDNAVRHGGHATGVVIDFYEEAGHGVIMVEDNGTGIPPERKKSIFERGYGRDSGLGLFLVREILDITGLGITETGTPGQGARFEITVPVGLFRFSGQPSP